MKYTDPELRHEAQELFTRMWFGVRKQGKQSRSEVSSVGSFSGCKYRGEDNTKCAVGQIIPDELYTPDLEGGLPWLPHKLTNRIDQPVNSAASELAAVLERHQSLLRQCQQAHDEAPRNGETFAEVYELRMQNIAKDFGLYALPLNAEYESLAAAVAERISDEQQDLDDGEFGDGYEQQVVDLLKKPTRFLAQLVRYHACNEGLLAVGRQTAKQFYLSTDRADFLRWILYVLCNVIPREISRDQEDPYCLNADQIRERFPWSRVRELNRETFNVQS